MKKLLLFAFLCLLYQTGFSQSFSDSLTGNPINTTGWLYATGTSSVSGASFTLTPNQGNETGWIYYNTPENLSACAQFTVDFYFQIQGQTGYNATADGVAFWYISNPPTAFGTQGANIGIPQYANGLVLIMDTYDNDNNMNNPVITLLDYNGSTQFYNEGSSTGVLTNTITNTAATLTSQSFVDNGSWHECKVTYNFGVINVYYDGSTTPTITANQTLNQTGYFGFSASTGAVTSLQSIKDVHITGFAAPPAPTATSPVMLCQYVNADSLTVTSGTQLTWFDMQGDTLTGAPTPNTGTPDTTYYAVTQGGTGACASPADTIQVIVNPQPVLPQIFGDTFYCHDAPFVPFNVTGENILWYAYDTSTVGTATAPFTNTDSSGTYTYYATQTVNGCPSAKDSVTVFVDSVIPPPQVSGPITYCYGAPFVPYTVVGQNVEWTDVNGNVSPIAPIVNTSSPGTYTFNVKQTIGNCTSADTIIQATVYPQTPPPLVADTTYCQGQSFAPLNVQGSNLLWYDSLTGGTGSIIAPTVNTNVAGVYTFYVSQTINGCEGSRAAVTVTVDSAVHNAFTYDIHYGCQADTVVFHNTGTGGTLFAWYFGDGHSDTTANPIHIYTDQGVYIATLYATNARCSDTVVYDTINLVHPIQPSFTLTADTICQGQSITFYNTSVGTQPVYFWDFGDGFGSLTDSPTHTFNIAGVYQVKLAENDFVPCFDTAVMTVFVDSTSAIDFTISDTSLCTGQAITFTGNYSDIGNIGNIWTFGDSTTATNINPVQHAYDSAGHMTISLTTLYRKCRDTTISKNVTIKPFPVLNLGPDTSICPNMPPIALNDLINAANPQAKWLWNTGDTASGILVATPGTYYSTVTIGGCSTSDSVWVKNDCYINMPNAFTPNGDGVNDYFFPRQLLTSGAVTFSMNIYNRWGEQIFTTTSTDGRGWDGKFNNVMQPAGVYIYMIDITFKNGTSKHFQGNVTLLQ